MILSFHIKKIEVRRANWKLSRDKFVGVDLSNFSKQPKFVWVLSLEKQIARCPSFIAMNLE